ncbi:MAG: bile acid:Na+ symporter, family [Thermoleophilales bacterium]|nr:bile acid:Na+ symporter, family [Thermoleophilales bacterium]
MNDDTPLFAIVLLPIALATIMFSLGLSLTVADFKRVFVVPKGVAIGLANLLVISPFLAFGIAELYGLAPELAVGLVLMGSAPGGTTANLLTHLARGDTALSVTMTAISSLAAVVTVPLYLTLSIEYFNAPVGNDVSMAGIVARVFGITVVPLAVGMWVRARSPERAAALEPGLRKAVFGFLALVIAAVAITEFGVIRDSFADLALATLTLNLAAMTVAYTVSRVARLDDRQSTAIALELGVHNGTLAIAVATTIDNTLATPAAVYSIFMFATAGLFARLMWRRMRLAAQAA